MQGGLQLMIHKFIRIYQVMNQIHEAYLQFCQSETFLNTLDKLDNLEKLYSLSH